MSKSDIEFLVTLLVGCSVLGAGLGAWVGHRFRGRGELGFILGGVLGLIGPGLGAIVMLFLSDHRRRCPHCRVLAEEGATVCQACTRELGSPGDTPPRGAK